MVQPYELKCINTHLSWALTRILVVLDRPCAVLLYHGDNSVDADGRRERRQPTRHASTDSVNNQLNYSIQSENNLHKEKYEGAPSTEGLRAGKPLGIGIFRRLFQH